MRLLYLNKIHTNAGWGAETFLNTALEELGVETICVDYEQNSYQLARYLENLDQDFDALLLQRGRGYLIPARTLRAIRRPRFFLFTELVARNAPQHYLLKNQLFDHIFLRSPACIEQVTERQWLQPDQVSLIRSAIRPDFHRPLPNVEKEIDVLFIGSLTPRRRAILDELNQVINVTVHSAFGDEMVDMVNRAKIILNIHAEKQLDTETRVYEVLACKGFLITEKLSAESPFTHGSHLVESSTSEELTSNIRYYLNQPESRKQIAETGYRKVITDHTYKTQATQIADIIEKHLATGDSAQPALDHVLLRQGVMEEVANNFVHRITYEPRRLWYKSRQFIANARAIK
jgi:hypothetical protein